MSLVEKQITRSLDKVIENFLKIGRLPDAMDVVSAASSYTGTPTLLPKKQPARTRSSIDVFNSNLLATVADLEVLFDEQIDQELLVGRQLAASDNEFRKLLNEIRDLTIEANEIVLANDVVLSLGAYSFDDFSSLKKVDTKRTTAVVDVDDTTVRLPVKFVSKVALPKLKPVITVWPKAPSKEIGSFMELTGETTGLWTLRVEERGDTVNTTVTIDVDLRDASKHGYEFNRLVIGTPLGPTDMGIAVLYKNSLTPDYTLLPTTIIAGRDTRTFEVNLSEIAGWSETPQIERYNKTNITSLRLVLTKSTPDEIIGGNYVHYFPLTSISLYRFVYKSDATLVSRSIELSSTKSFTLHSATLAAGGVAPAGSRVDFYIAEDRYLPAYFANSSDEYRKAGSPDITQVISDTTATPSPTGVLQTELRDWAILNGGYTFNGEDYADWEPEWKKITPTEGFSQATIGDVGQKVANFNNAMKVIGDDIVWADPSGTIEDSVGGINFYRVAEFFTEPILSTIVLRQGRDTWKKTVEDVFVVRTEVGHGPLDGDLEDPTWEARGSIIRGSVKNVKTVNGPENEYYISTGADAQYYVEYFDAPNDDKMVIHANKFVGNDMLNLADDIEFTVNYSDPETIVTWETYFYLEEGEKGALQIDGGAISSITVIAYSRDDARENGRKVLGSDNYVDLTEVGQSSGWYKVSIVARSDTWSPLDSVVVIGSPKQWYWMAPLKVVPYHELTNRTSAEDHAATAIHFADDEQYRIADDNTSSVWLAVNDPTYPSDQNGEKWTQLINLNINGGLPLTAADIFSNASSIGAFYSLSYTGIGALVDHALVKFELHTNDRNITPVIDGYSIRVVSA